ncbi:ankyrin repeat and LEM domain-containing protein 2 [Spea bombifrons]|uniref:ankyrin repeat and LEM domain-containing protein 2 n=1 Tax=Spea bombifrons TaxID=233779 RepID=UPI00234BECE9|nr:ankyrin repeat and LEM domain-containing protein 2 [Spea bombifrons]
MPLSGILATLDSSGGWPALLACVLVALVGWFVHLAERRHWKQSRSVTPSSTPQPDREELLEQPTMDKLLSRLKLLSPDELREQILTAGLTCGPITSTTRFIFEKKLARALLEQQGTDVCHSSKPLDGNAAELNGQHPVHFRQGSDDQDFGYSVGVNPPAEESAFLDKSCLPPGKTVGDSQTCSQPLSKNPPVYYAVCPVYEDALARNEKVHIYTDKKEALHVVKMLKGSRFKAFSSREDAEKFARGMCDYCPSPSKNSSPLSPVKLVSNVLRDGVSSPEVESINKEKANSFKSPRTQDLTAKLRKAVEKGDLVTFSELIWSNPRYLIGSGDNPTVVQEGCRYNVMHVAARENQAAICQLLLDTLENPEFMRLMYPDDDDIMLQKRIRYIVDLYLNTPDKMAFDTPLHFACKFGNPDVVNVLCSHPDILKKPRNKYDQTPEEVVCERSKNKPAELKAKIKECLKGIFYVPLLRAEDNSSPTVLGTPWSPEQPDVLSQTKYSGSPKDPLLAVRAFAGPMSPSKAEDFRRAWKTPPRDKAGLFHNVRKTDPERGAERVGRELANELDVPWVEYWEFLGCFTDLSSQDGLGKLEEYLSKRHSSGERMLLEPDHEICNKYKTPSPAGKSKKFCNSVSVGAYLDEEEDLSLEEIKNRQNAALKHGHSPASAEAIAIPECIMDAPDLSSSTQPNEANLGFFSPLCTERILPGDRRQQALTEGMLSPVSNLMAEFEKLSLAEEIQNYSDRHQKEDSPLTSERAVDDQWNLLPSRLSPRTECSHLSQVEKLLPDLSLQDRNLPPGSNNDILRSCSSSETATRQFIMKTPPKNQSSRGTFLLGKEPSKLDGDVLLAIEKVEIDKQKYPCISKWLNAVQSYTPSDRHSWPSPAVLSGRSRSQMFSSSSPGSHGFSTPGRHSPVPGSPGKYMNLVDHSSPGRYSPAYASHIQILRLRHFSDHSAV